jgi:hypothetical protein
MFELSEQVLWLLLVIPAFYYLGVPLLILFQQKMQAHPRLDALDFDRLGPSISEFLVEQTKALFALGFDEPTLVQLPKPVNNVSSYLVLLVKRDTGDKAMVTAVIGGQGPAALKSFGVEFSTRFDTGEVFDTHNYQTLMAFPPLPTTTRTQVPTVKDGRELFALHSYVINKHAPRGTKTVYAPGTALDYLVEFAFSRKYEGQAQRGWLYYDEVQDVYRFTTKGAYLVTWGLLQPIKTLRLAILHKRARSILQEFRQNVQSTPAIRDGDEES